MKILLIPIIFISVVTSFGQVQDHTWRAATPKELKALIPSKVAVENEKIETEFRTASGIADGNGKFIAGVVMITAGYSAEGKYTHYFITQVTLECDDFELRPGQYVFGHKRTDQNTLELKFYEASNGRHVGDLKASLDPKRGPIRSLAIVPLGGERAVIRIGRFFFECTVKP